MHSAMQISRDEILFVEYLGHSILRYNLATGEQKKIELAGNEFFNGHALLSPDGQYLFTV